LTRRFVPVLAVAILALLSFAIAASAHKKTFATDVTAAVVDPSAEAKVVSGKVTSPKKACLAKRKVVATFVDLETVSTKTVGQTVTSASGAFSITLSKEAQNTIVLLEVKQKRVAPKTKKHRHLCGVASTGVPVS
jgi:hypothetical protein